MISAHLDPQEIRHKLKTMKDSVTASANPGFEKLTDVHWCAPSRRLSLGEIGRDLGDSLIDSPGDHLGESRCARSERNPPLRYCNNGRGLFNHRMVWPINYNVDSIYDKPMRLHIAVRSRRDIRRDTI